MPDLQTIGRALSGFGAGVAGRGPEFIAGLRAEERTLSDERKRAMLEDAFTMRNQLQAGDVGGARALLQDRLESIQELGGDPTDTAALLQRLDGGDIPGAFREVSTLVEFAQAEGLLAAPRAGTQPKRSIKDGQVITIDPRTGRASAQPVEGFTPSRGAAQDRGLRERQIAVSEATEKRQAGKLSAGLEKFLIDAQDRVVSAQRNANNYDVLAKDFEQRNLEGGVKSTFSETLKGILGTQDDVSEFRRRFNQVRLSEGLKNLPPGPATDRDVKEAFKGVPKESASVEQVASFLRGAARLARFEAGYNQFKADFISADTVGRGTRGLNKAWRGRIDSPKLNREVSIAEVYEAAQNRGVPPEDIAEQLGITGGLF